MAAEDKEFAEKYMNDPEFPVVKERAESFSRFYSNRAIIVMTGADIRVEFLNVLGGFQGKIHVQEQCSVSMSFHHAKSLAAALNGIIERNKAFFDAIPEIKEELENEGSLPEKPAE